MASESAKRTECVRVCMEEKMFIDLNRLAILDDRKLSEYIYRVLWRHKYGHGNPPGSDNEGQEVA